MEVGGSLNVNSLLHYARVNYTNTRLIRGCLGPRAGLDVSGEEKILVPAKNRFPSLPARNFTKTCTKYMAGEDKYQLQWEQSGQLLISDFF